MWTFVALGAVVGGLALGGVGFVLGASVPDERAGEAASLAAKVGLAAGSLLGGAIGALAHWLMR